MASAPSDRRGRKGNVVTKADPASVEGGEDEAKQGPRPFEAGLVVIDAVLAYRTM